MSHYKPYPAYKDSGVEWLGRVPEHWKVKKVLYWISGYGSGTTPSREDEYSEHGLHWVTTSELRENIVSTTEKRVTAEAIKNNSALKLHPTGSLIIAMYGATVGRLGVLGVDAALNQACFAIHPNAFVRISFLANWFEGYRSELIALASGAGQPNISAEKIRNLLLACPEDVYEQDKIVDHLDRETARIDALIQKKTRFIELLKEKRQALITHAVTKGLDPAAKMKDSGVEWLGEVPEHWDVKALKLLVKEGSTISYGIVQPGEPLDEGVPFIQTTNMSSGNFNIEDLQKTTTEIAAAFPRSRLIGGEVVLGIRASIGAAFVVPAHLAGANLSRGVARIDCASKLSSGFLVSYLNSCAADNYWQLAKQGSTFSEVSIATVKELLVSVPPLDEQNKILRYLDRETGCLASLLNATERSIELLKERRAALITAAVTGQIDLREAV